MFDQNDEFTAKVPIGAVYALFSDIFLTVPHPKR